MFHQAFLNMKPAWEEILGVHGGIDVVPVSVEWCCHIDSCWGTSGLANTEKDK